MALVVLAGLASFGAPPLAAHVLPGVPVVVAAHDLAPGERLEERDLTTTMVRPDLVPDGAARDPHEVAGETTGGPISRGALVLREHLREEESGLSADKALVSLPIEEGSVVDGAEPGTQLRLVCEQRGSEDFASAEALTEVRAILRESRAPSASGAAPFAAAGAPVVTVEVDRAHISTIAHCTRSSPPLIAVVG